MIKQIGLFYMVAIMCMPRFAFAADHCTNPSEYTIDKRCYVTDEQKSQYPYNAVVAIVDSDDVYCTGTFATFDGQSAENMPRNVLTAKHCTDGNYDNSPDKTLTIRLQDGREINVVFAESGNYNLSDEYSGKGDWAIYKIDDSESLPGIKPFYASKSGVPNDVSVLGYGNLKIMSDAEIAKFKQRYMEFLAKDNMTPKIDDEGKYKYADHVNYGLYVDGGLETLHNKVDEFIDKIKNDDPDSKLYAQDIFGDTQLKISRCTNNNCQVWSGDSGGPWFDASGNLVAISGSGYLNIGGETHAKMATFTTTESIYTERQK